MAVPRICQYQDSFPLAVVNGAVPHMRIALLTVGRKGVNLWSCQARRILRAGAFGLGLRAAPTLAICAGGPAVVSFPASLQDGFTLFGWFQPQRGWLMSGVASRQGAGDAGIVNDEL